MSTWFPDLDDKVTCTQLTGTFVVVGLTWEGASTWVDIESCSPTRPRFRVSPESLAKVVTQ